MIEIVKSKLVMLTLLILLLLLLMLFFSAVTLRNGVGYPDGGTKWGEVGVRFRGEVSSFQKIPPHFVSASRFRDIF